MGKEEKTIDNKESIKKVQNEPETKVEEKAKKELTQKEKVKKFIEQAIKSKKIQMKDVIEFISKENIDSEYVTKIYD